MQKIDVFSGTRIFITDKDKAYDYAVGFLPKKIKTESKENGDKSGDLQVYRHDGDWFIRYLDAHIEHDKDLDVAACKMQEWLKGNKNATKDI